MTTDPTDAELHEFVAHFVGYKNLWRDKSDQSIWSREPGGSVPVPDYLHDLNAWHRDVWGKIETTNAWLSAEWSFAMDDIYGDGNHAKKHNADARSRCLALWRALGGKLPERSES